MKYSDFVKEVFKVQKGTSTNATIKAKVLKEAPGIKSMKATQVMKVAGRCWKKK